MNHLKGVTAYLAGAIEHVDDSESGSWRDTITATIESEFGMESIDPLIKPQWFPDISNDEQRGYNQKLIEGCTESDRKNKVIRRACLACAGNANIIICKLPRKFTVGTFEELSLANSVNKPILFISPGREFPSMWAHAQFCQESDNWRDVFFPNEYTLVEYLRNVDKGEQVIDQYKWIFLSWRDKYAGSYNHKI
jgi:hypothetical protein